jgi:hypothetical protein
MKSLNISTTTQRRVAAIPALQEFVAHAGAILSTGDLDAFWKCQPHFETLMRSGFERELLNHELSRMTQDGFYTPASSTETWMTVIECELFTLKLILLDQQRTRPHRTYDIVENYMLCMLGPGPVELELFHQPSPFPHDVLDRSKRLIPGARTQLEPGAIYPLRAAEDVPLLLSTGRPSLLVSFNSRPVLNICWEYVLDTLLPDKMIAAQPTSCRLEQATWVLAEMKDSSAIPALGGLLEHEQHHVRWAAIRAVMRLDQMAGMKLLRQALGDPHPYIRNAALRALEKWDAKPTSMQGAEGRCAPASH